MDSISSIKAASLTNLSKWFSIRVLVRTMTAILHLQTVKKYVSGGHALGLNQIVFQLNDSGSKITSQIFSTNLRSDSVPEIPPVNMTLFDNIYRTQSLGQGNALLSSDPDRDPLDREPPWDRDPPGKTPPTGQRCPPVRILLECIFVYIL